MILSQSGPSGLRHTDSDKIIKRMKLCRTTLSRILEDEYSKKDQEEYYKKYPIRGGLNKELFYNHGPEAFKERKVLYKKQGELKAHDWELFLKHFRQAERFWD